LKVNKFLILNKTHKMIKLFFPLLGTLLLCTTSSIAQDSLWTSKRPDGHAPISVMGDHIHKKGGFMFSYRYMTMSMKGTISSSSRISDEAIYSNYMVSPQTMQMAMHMIGAMYAPSDNLTLVVMANYRSSFMDLKTKMGINFSTTSDGFGDVLLASLYSIFNRNHQSLHTNIGISIPVGGINQRDATPMAVKSPLAYAMQLGSGTFDPFMGATYLRQWASYSMGIQSTYRFRLGNNSKNYSLGNRFVFVGWGAIKASDYLSFSTSINYFNVDKIKGEDPDLNQMMMPLFNTVNSGRSQLDLGIGANVLFSDETLKNLRLAAEVKLPIAQDVTGIQMKNKVSVTIGIQYALAHH